MPQRETVNREDDDWDNRDAKADAEIGAMFDAILVLPIETPEVALG